MNRPTTHVARGLAVAIAGATVGLTATAFAISSDDADHDVPSSVEQGPVADWATGHRLSGLSPASVGAGRSPAAATSDLVRELAEFARDHGLTGLSPASLHPIGD